MTDPPHPADDSEPVAERPVYVLSLFITGASLQSTRAIVNIQQLCEQYLPGQYELEIIDVYQQRELAGREQLIALPLLIKRFPLPEQRFVGDLSDTQKILAKLDISTQKE